MNFYYKNFYTELNTLVFGGKTVDRYPVNEYFNSSSKSEFQIPDNRYEKKDNVNDLEDHNSTSPFLLTANHTNFAANSTIFL